MKPTIIKLVEEDPKEAKRFIREAFAENGYDYYRTARFLKCHHYTLRKLARSLDMTTMLVKERAKAIKKGERANPFGRPKKPFPGATSIQRAYARNGYNAEETAKALGVSAPTLRTWCRDHGIALTRPEAAA